MKRIVASLFILFSILFLSSAVNISEADKIIGNYWSPDKDGKISIYKKGEYYYGKSIESKNPKLKDVNNPNPKLRDWVLLGQDFFLNFKYKGGEYVDGIIYNPLDGNTYNAIMWVKDNKLFLRGYVGFSIFGVTKEMEKIKE